jgi:hypothetical protein
MTSGSWRRAARRAVGEGRRVAAHLDVLDRRAQVAVLDFGPDPRIVTTWQARVRLISPMIAANVDVLPDPVGPVTQHQAARQPGEVGEARREAEPGEGRDLRRQRANRRGELAALAVGR